MKRYLCCILTFVMLITLTACIDAPAATPTTAPETIPETIPETVPETLPKVEYHPTGLADGGLYVNVDGNTYFYKRYAPGIGSLTPGDHLGTFGQMTEIEGIVWDIYAAEEYPDLSYVLAISGTNIECTYRIAEDVPYLIGKVVQVRDGWIDLEVIAHASSYLSVGDTLPVEIRRPYDPTFAVGDYLKIFFNDSYIHMPLMITHDALIDICRTDKDGNPIE